jgi:hypothetical protein
MNVQQVVERELAGETEEVGKNLPQLNLPATDTGAILSEFIPFPL